MSDLEFDHLCGDDEVYERRVQVDPLDERLPCLTEDVRQYALKLVEASLDAPQGICFEAGAVFRGLEGPSPCVGLVIL